ncbi:MAG: glycosyltransferase family 2 protein, partial [Candidatus Acidiferrum sp.]
SLWGEIASGARKHLETKFSREQFDGQIRKIIARVAELPTKAMDPEYAGSYRAVEKTNPEVLNYRPAKYRMLLRAFAYWQAGRKQLVAGRPIEALVQYRHVFSTLRAKFPAAAFHAQLFCDMEQAYRATGGEQAAKCCVAECLRLGSTASIAKRQDPRRKRGAERGGENIPEISVIIPTYNRKETLRLCLAALAFQTLPAERWEIVVVDDGSSDGTDLFCRDYVHPNSNLRFIRQENQGAGAARRTGVEAARGEFILLMNDDTIASSDLLAEHFKIQRENRGAKLAVLGAFRASDECVHRALSCWINRSPFFFPQNTLKPGRYQESAYFITCNLSIRREAVLEAGNFDPQFRVAEDTELGARLRQRSYEVLFHPDAEAWHEHGRFTLPDLLRRAGAYGQADWLLFQKHPELLGSGTGPFGKLQEGDFARLKATVEKNREAVAVAMNALELMEEMEMLPLFRKRTDGTTAAGELWLQLAKVVPMVYWQYLFESFLRARETVSGQQSSEEEMAPRTAAMR